MRCISPTWTEHILQNCLTLIWKWMTQKLIQNFHTKWTYIENQQTYFEGYNESYFEGYKSPPSPPLPIQLLFVHFVCVRDQKCYKTGAKSQIAKTPTFILQNFHNLMTFLGQCYRSEKVATWFSFAAGLTSAKCQCSFFSGSYNDSVSHILRHIENLSSFSITFSSLA